MKKTLLLVIVLLIIVVSIIILKIYFLTNIEGFNINTNTNTNTNINVNNPPYSNTLPSSECQDGFPVNKYSEYGTESLYNIWTSYQNSAGSITSYNNASNNVPTSRPTTGPLNIFIIRHGEKNPTGTDDYHLNNNGISRSHKLISFVNKLAAAGTPISYIVTCNPCPYNTSDASMRPQQTISMVSFMLNIPMFIFSGSQDYDKFISGVFDSGSFDGLNILVCWEHESIQGLCLNILNKAAKLTPSRLNLNTPPSNEHLSGDQFFYEKGITSNELCPDGNYLCPAPSSLPSESAYYVDTTTPSYIGPNSQYYPYWNNYDYQSVFWFKSSVSTSYKFDFSFFDEPYETCYPNCKLHIGLYQPLKAECEPSNIYINGTPSNNQNPGGTENNCQVPNNWSV